MPNAAVLFWSSLSSAITAPSLRCVWPSKLGIEGHSRNGHWTLGMNALPPRCSFTRYASRMMIVVVLWGGWTSRLEISPLYPMIHEVERQQEEKSCNNHPWTFNRISSCFIRHQIWPSLQQNTLPEIPSLLFKSTPNHWGWCLRQRKLEVRSVCWNLCRNQIQIPRLNR